MYYDSHANTIDGWMSTCGLTWLFDKASKAESVLEVGSWKGKSAHALLSGCKGSVICVDHFKGSLDELTTTHKEATEHDIYEDFLKNVGAFPNLIVLKKSSLEAVKEIADNSIDMIFIDGGHTYEEAKADIVAWLPKCKGLFCGHDYDLAHIPQISEELNLNIKPVLIDSLWVLER